MCTEKYLPDRKKLNTMLKLKIKLLKGLKSKEFGQLSHYKPFP